MMKNTKLTDEQKTYVENNYGKGKTAVQIAKELNVPLNSIYRFAQKKKLSKKLNPVFEITNFQEQIILGGILGDGSFKKNGSNYYYRECHAIPEAEYLEWKFNALKNLTTSKLYNIPKRKESQNDQIGFQTVNTPSLNPYVHMDIDEVIDKLDELGIIIWLLDDGWIRKNSKVHSYGVSTADFTDEQINRIIQKLDEFGLSAHIIGTKKELSLCSVNNARIKEIAYKFFPKDMDIIKKKINDLHG